MPNSAWVDLFDPDEATLRAALPAEVHSTAMARLLAPPVHDDEPRPRLEHASRHPAGPAGHGYLFSWVLIIVTTIAQLRVLPAQTVDLTMVDEETRRRREQTVREHMDAENRGDFAAALATFARPRYELMGLDRTFDGPDAVAEYFRTSRLPFPDQRNELISLRHADDAVVVELWLLGTHLGPLGDLAPTGREFRSRMVALFIFEGDGLVCERVYFNPNEILAQLTA